MRTSEEIFKSGVKKQPSRWLPIEEKIYRHPAKRLFLLGISERKNEYFIKAAHFELSRWLLFGGYLKATSKELSPRICKEIVNFLENTYKIGLSHWE